jgi:hypothetical protein
MPPEAGDAGTATATETPVVKPGNMMGRAAKPK